MGGPVARGSGGRTAWVVIALCAVLMASCDRAARESSGTTAAPPSDSAVSSACAEMTGLPFPLRREALSRAGDPDAVIEEMRSVCPDVVETLETLESVVEESAKLDDPEGLRAATSAASCDPMGVTVPFTNPFDSPVRLIVAGRFLDAANQTLSVGGEVSGVVEPGASVDLTVGLEAPPGTADCTIESQVFLEPDTDVTDTWDSSLGLAPVLPETTGDEWTRILSELISAELEAEQTGEGSASGAFEDVRSKNYRSLTSTSPEDSGTSYEVLAVCRARPVDDGLMSVTYEFALDDVDRALGLGVFRRSPQDGHWRWVHTAVLLDVGGEGCALLGGFAFA